MIYARVVANNRPEEETDGTPIMSVTSMGIDNFTGEIVLRGKDAALDSVVIRAPFGSMIQVYH